MSCRPDASPIVTKHVEQTRIEQVCNFLKQQVDMRPPGLRGLSGY